MKPTHVILFNYNETNPCNIVSEGLIQGGPFFKITLLYIIQNVQQ